MAARASAEGKLRISDILLPLLVGGASAAHPAIGRAMVGATHALGEIRRNRLADAEYQQRLAEAQAKAEQERQRQMTIADALAREFQAQSPETPFLQAARLAMRIGDHEKAMSLYAQHLQALNRQPTESRPHIVRATDPQAGQEVLVAYDLETGEEKWRRPVVGLPPAEAKTEVPHGRYVTIVNKQSGKEKMVWLPSGKSEYSPPEGWSFVRGGGSDAGDEEEIPPPMPRIRSVQPQMGEVTYETPSGYIQVAPIDQFNALVERRRRAPRVTDVDTGEIRVMPVPNVDAELRARRLLNNVLTSPPPEAPARQQAPAGRQRPVATEGTVIRDPATGARAVLRNGRWVLLNPDGGGRR